MRKLGYLVVEGPHDVEFSCRLLKHCAKLKRVTKEEVLEEELRKLIPRKYPPDGDLVKRMSIPAFMQNETWAVAIQSAGGDSKIASCLQGTFDLLPVADFAAVGVILDSDSEKAPAQRHVDLLKLVAEKTAGLEFPKQAGTVSDAKTRTGVFVLPDNTSPGTLEDLLLEAGALAYSNQLSAAKDFLAAAIPHCTHESFADLHLPAGRNKAMVGAVAMLLKPGKAIQVSIQDNEWLSDDGLKLERLNRIVDFTRALLSL